MITLDEVRQLVLEECFPMRAPDETIGDDDVLFGDDERWGFDSIDFLQLAMAIQYKYGVKLSLLAQSDDGFLVYIRNREDAYREFRSVRTITNLINWARDCKDDTGAGLRNRINERVFQGI